MLLMWFKRFISMVNMLLMWLEKFISMGEHATNVV